MPLSVQVFHRSTRLTLQRDKVGVPMEFGLAQR